MKNKYKLMCGVIALTLVISLACVPAMAYQISNVILPLTDTDTQFNNSSSVSSFVQGNDTDAAAMTTDVMSDFSSYNESWYMSSVESTDSTNSSEIPWWESDTEILTDTEIQTDIMLAETDTDTIDLTDTDVTDTEKVATDDDYNEDESYQPHTNNDYTPLYSTVEDTNRSTITGENWSNISIDMDNSKGSGKININNNGKGDFSFIKDNKANSGKSTLYYWLVGGISCVAIGLCGFAFVVVTAYDKKKKSALAAKSRKKRTLSRGDTAEIDIKK